LLEKAFIVFRLQPFNKNIRTEISTNRKIYFYDNGIRNAIIRNFTTIDLRNDVGALWENFLIAEKMKARHYSGWNGRAYYWRTYAQQEIDYVEESNGNYSIYEFKWSAKQQAKFPITFLKAYKPIEKQVITPENIDDFLL
jgi:predicted AAA+ superfamily ATPase